VSREQEAVRIGRGELVEIESPPEIRRQQAFAKPGLWAGIATTQPGLLSGWHQHGGHDTIVYVLSGRLRSLRRAVLVEKCLLPTSAVRVPECSLGPSPWIKSGAHVSRKGGISCAR
jgi:hypothetical protein